MKVQPRVRWTFVKDLTNRDGEAQGSLMNILIGDFETLCSVNIPTWRH